MLYKVVEEPGCINAFGHGCIVHEVVADQVASPQIRGVYSSALYCEPALSVQVQLCKIIWDTG